MVSIEYRFRLQCGKEEIYQVRLDPDTMTSLAPVPDVLPDWTLLSSHQCENCPLPSDRVERCPAAIQMVALVHRFKQLLSYELTMVIVRTDERVIYKRTTIQRGVCSLMGLLMASSGCPLMAFFKPMARFHLPFSSSIETLWRAASCYLMIQYFKKLEGSTPDYKFKELSDFYAGIQKVNSSFARRLHSACEQDSMVNAVILLDMYAQSMPTAISESLEGLRHLFVPYLALDRTM